MSLNDIIQYIMNNESDFLDDNGFLDSDYIRERFNLNYNQLKIVKQGLEFH